MPLLNENLMKTLVMSHKMCFQGGCFIDICLMQVLQTMVYFYDPIDLEQDQLIDGSLTLTQSRENRRFMNIHLEYT